MNKDEKVLFDKVEDAMNSFEGREKVIYDLDEGLELCKVFLKKVEIHRKDFKKLSKKLNEKTKDKEINKFIDERLKKPFLFYFAEKFFKNNELEILKDEKDRPAGVMVLIQDITEHVKLDNMRKEFVADKNIDYVALNSHIAGEVLMQVGRTYFSFFRNKTTKRKKIPRYKPKTGFSFNRLMP